MRKDLRNDAMEYFLNKIRLMIVQNLDTSNLKDEVSEKVRKIPDINAYIWDKENISKYLMDMLFYLFYGIFDRKRYDLYFFSMRPNNS